MSRAHAFLWVLAMSFGATLVFVSLGWATVEERTARDVTFMMGAGYALLFHWLWRDPTPTDTTESGR